MTTDELIAQRLHRQKLTDHSFTNVQDVVSWMGLVQAQDFNMAKWALGLRMKKATDASVEKAFNDGSILRTHILRPTWHFVAPADIRSFLKLTAPQVHRIAATAYKKLEIDTSLMKKCFKAFEKSLSQAFLTRDELQVTLERSKVHAERERLGHILFYAELEGVICSGPRKDHHFTYALLDQRVPPSPILDRAEALSTLLLRFVKSRGPVTAHDFAKWAGLSLKEVHQSIQDLGLALTKVSYQDTALFVDTSTASLDTKQTVTLLLPEFDEYASSYKEKDFWYEGLRLGKFNPVNRKRNEYIIIAEGQFGGLWNRTVKSNKEVSVTLSPILKRSKTFKAQINDAVKKYYSFLDQNNKRKA
jgi:hypothetical protein